ncbi:hypothetical protein HAX54_002554 [Datura stramonium]|uniref:Uncharacterized protein n=1 Tax=Datura stramonium TaxID=4076 RepID=A0ABS8WTT5_DATST|nr:hypothetical protein [Datura stramonium]
MESKGKEVVVADPSFERARKEKMGTSSSTSNVDPARRFGAKMKDRLALEFPAIQDKIRELGVGYIFNKPERCNLALVREFYANWDTSFGGSTKVKIRGQNKTCPTRAIINHNSPTKAGLTQT